MLFEIRFYEHFLPKILSKSSIENVENLSPELKRIIDFIWQEAIGDFKSLFDSNICNETNLFSKFNIQQVFIN